MKINRNNKLVLCNEKQLDITERMLIEGRRYFGSSGASLTHQVDNPTYEDKGINPELAAVGLEGEHKTSKLLLDWIKDKPAAVLVDSVHLKTYGEETLNEETGTMDGGDTDHVLIIGKYVIIIDSKNWKSRRRYSINDRGEVLRGNSSFPGGKISTLRASRLWAEALKPHRAIISSLVNISAEKVQVTRNKNWWKQPYRLVTIETLEDFLNEVWASFPESSKNYIDANLVTSVASNALKPYNFFKEHLGETAKLLEV